ncbi:hypothetical protein FCN80_22940 [Martelella alba]|uniref:Uncharacterized protein n=1 Tax=Martelella alba TaxID=2590451 RepID=A0ABY2SG02_9HYPH|nr:hypothetical protein FCN80_22940 [Martelella alba]
MPLLKKIHIFDDDTLWVVDQGATHLDRNAQKVLQFDIKTGNLMKKITFNEQALPRAGVSTIFALTLKIFTLPTLVLAQLSLLISGLEKRFVDWRITPPPKRVPIVRLSVNMDRCLQRTTAP